MWHASPATWNATTSWKPSRRSSTAWSTASSPAGRSKTLDLRDKATAEQIRARFDRDVERFSNFEAGQNTAIDSALSQALLRDSIVAENPAASRLLDIGCGAGNFSLHLAAGLRLSSITLLDLSRPMLDRALERLSAATQASLTAIQSDIRDFDPGEKAYDVVVAGAVLHHLRGEEEWESVFARIRDALAPGGLFAVYDLIDHGSPGVRRVMWDYYRQYLTDTLGPDMAQRVFRVLDTEDSPRGLMDQLRLLERLGFADVEVVHKHATFAAFLARRR